MKITFAVIILSLLCAFAPAVESVRLEYNLKVGDEFEMKQQSNQNIKQTIMGMAQEGTSEYAATLLLKVSSVNSESAELDVQFVKLRNSSTTIMGENTMDSEGPQDNAQNKAFKSMMNKPFKVTLKKTGEIEKVSNAENLWSEIGNIGLEEGSVKAIKEAIGPLLSESSLKKSLGQSMVRYPDKKIKEGETWTSRSDFPMDFPIQIDNTWKLAKIQGPVATIEATGVYTTIDTDRIITLPGGFKSKVNLAGTQSVNATVKDKTGWSELTVIQSALKGKMILQAGGIVPTDMEVPMESTTKTSYTVVKK